MDERLDVKEERESAERELRRGNLKDALAIYRRLVQENPGEEALAGRLRDLEELLQPMELTHPKAAAGGGSAPQTAVHEAEAAANRGEIGNAIAVYERLLAESPENELYQDRLQELCALAKDPLTATAMPRSRPPRPRETPAFSASLDPAMPMMDRAKLQESEVDAPPSSPETPTDDLPADPVELLQELLVRVTSNRRRTG